MVLCDILHSHHRLENHEDKVARMTNADRTSRRLIKAAAFALAVLWLLLWSPVMLIPAWHSEVTALEVRHNGVAVAEITDADVVAEVLDLYEGRFFARCGYSSTTPEATSGEIELRFHLKQSKYIRRGSMCITIYPDGYLQTGLGGRGYKPLGGLQWGIDAYNRVLSIVEAGAAACG